MRRGTCPKCGSATVRAAANGIDIGDHVRTPLRPHLEPDFRGVVGRHLTDLWAFACTTCGYVELHMLDAEAIAFVTDNWIPVPPAGPPVTA